MSLRPNPAMTYMANINAKEIRRQQEADRAQAKAQQEAAHTQAAQDWLKDRRIINDNMTLDERRAVLRAYRKRLATAPQDWVREPHLWAHTVLSEIADGVIVSPLAARWAKEVVNRERGAA